MGTIAGQADSVSNHQGWPTTRASNEAATNKRNAMRFAAFIHQVKTFLGTDQDDVAWAGSPAVPEQLLAGVQAALVSKPMADCVCPPTPAAVMLIVRV